MPCRCDIPDPSERAYEAKRVAKHLVYLSDNGPDYTFDFEIEDWVREVAKASEFWIDRELDLDEDVNVLTATLCEYLTELDGTNAGEELIWNGRNSKARSLASWWEAHQEEDRKRIKAEREQEKMELTRKKALAKLTRAERKALGV